ncbi:MAG: GxxExxY protein [Alphaproteobacteria bacterium]|nr:GxxExxY protein [Alphaproteobacteria bacterium]
MSVLKKYNDVPDDLEDLSKTIVDSAFRVHKFLGAGYLEKIYEDCFCIELQDRGISFERQYPLKMEYNVLYRRKLRNFASSRY